MQNRNKGITLIALIITIIVMLILVAVSVNVLIKSNLIGTAEKAVDKYKTASEEEANGGTIEINGKKYASIEDYIEATKPLPEGAGKRADKTKEYSDGTKTAWIPAGFTVSGIRSETTIDGGLVIYDIPEGTTVDWTNPDSVKTVYNQFVWIPVEVTSNDTETSIAAFTRSTWAENTATGGERTTNLSEYCTEPGFNNKNGIGKQIAILTKSIYKYGGFYVGRYEAGIKPNSDGTSTPRTSSSSQTAEFVVQQDKYPYLCVKWGKSMTDISEGAVYLSNSLYNTNEYGATSMLCTGACWDSMLDFIKDSNHSVTDSTTWGNYSNSETYKIYRGSLYSNSSWSQANTTNGTDVTKDTAILLTTGATERNCSKNIYDVAGNCKEWTTEYNSFYSDTHIYRGGAYSISGSRYPASIRYNVSAITANSDVSFRPILYVNI